MPPPPLNPQGSRTGLITAVVVLAIVFVVATVFAFYYNRETDRVLLDNKSLNDKLRQYVGDQEADPRVQGLIETGKESGQSAIGAALAQVDELAKVIGSTSATAVQDARAAVAQTIKKDVNGVTLTQGAALIPTLTAVTDQAKRLEEQVAAETARAKAAIAGRAQDAALRKAMEAKLTGEFQAEGEKLTATVQAFDASRGATEKSVEKIQTDVERALKEAQGQVSAATKELQERNELVDKLQKEIDVLKQLVIRPDKTAEPVIRQIDGEIVRVPGNDNCFINLGQGHQIAPGLTFEVYDRTTGIPAPTQEEQAVAGNTPAVPKGKASIEVVKPGVHQSECRIIRSSVQDPIIEGDVIGNLVYDKNTKYNFVVFGDFDLDQSGTPTPGDAAVIKRLITQWGGRVQDAVNVNADFIVLGYEPEVPAPEENEGPGDIARRQAAQEAYDAYQKVRNEAIDLNIPILNQNRFLYYVGYFELAQR